MLRLAFALESAKKVSYSDEEWGLSKKICQKTILFCRNNINKPYCLDIYATVVSRCSYFW